MKDNELVLYMDASIRLGSGEIDPLLDKAKQTGYLSTYLPPFKITCYTNPKMFEWFGENADDYQDIFSMEAGTLILYKNLLNMILMKAWLTCALDKDCIAPAGSRISPCCGCHRY